MTIVSFADIETEAWDAFCAASPDAWLWHTTGGIELGCAFRENCENLSFGLTIKGSLIAVIPLILENIAGTEQKEFAMDGTPLPFPALKSSLGDMEKKEALEFIFAEIDHRAHAKGVTKSIFCVDPLAESSAVRNKNPLLAFGYDDVSIKTSIVDLKKNESELLSHIRKTHRADIQFAETKGASAEFSMNAAALPNVFSIFKNLYFAAAGKEVGNPVRWEKTHSLFKRGNILIVLGKSNDSAEYGTCLAALYYKKCAYYALSGIVPEFRKSARGLGHFIQWETMKYLKAHGYETYELGWQVSDADEKATPKERTIAEFKARFGGDLVPLWRGGKHYR